VSGAVQRIADVTHPSQLPWQKTCTPRGHSSFVAIRRSTFVAIRRSTSDIRRHSSFDIRR
jgi:hypothetical protein